MILIKNALLADNSHKDLLIENGQFIQINDTINASTNNIIDCQGRLLLSGMIDPHVHFRDPGFPHKEDAHSGSMAAARGGVTSVIDMPNTDPLCVTATDLEHKRAIYTQKSYINFGFHFGGDARDNSEQILKARNFAALKIFLNESTGHMLIENDNVLDKLFKTTPYIAVHAEGDAVDKAIHFAKKYGNILYLCHISQEGELAFIKKAKQQKLPIFAEVCPHHILFNNTHETELLIMKPRLRTKKDQNSLLEALDSGLIDTWGTDHAPHLAYEKQEKITYGIPSIEFALEILLTIAKEMKWNYQKVQNLYSMHTAKIFKIQNKGIIRPATDADFVIIDQESNYKISQSDTISKASWSPYIGYKSAVQIHNTYIGGQCIYDRETHTFNKSEYTKELRYER